MVISDKFKDAHTPISRHRLVNATLQEEVAANGPVHALSIIAMTPDKWNEMVKNKGGVVDDVVGPSPKCRGGDGSLPPKSKWEWNQREVRAWELSTQIINTNV